jgi:hypothetical protein
MPKAQSSFNALFIARIYKYYTPCYGTIKCSSNTKNYKNENYAKLLTNFETFNEYINAKEHLKFPTMKAVTVL